MSETILVDGELHLTLEAVADVYRVQPVWLRRAYDSGLLGAGVLRERTVCIPAVRLERVARVVRLHVVLGLDLDAIELALGEP